ncbi:NUDIX domain-containing protein [Bacillus sp. B15-48]|uniref:NUDIX domain-containing protein n=1 Tax=Bacillus sp. B15-48 TaxID=1548601 RepID=UPI00193F0DB3|nr:NUDIX domain-containing protein [Bacillus sp. B15-48]MBM4764813.1 NUDIX domain-containing protein [Bacillus sp. B15-48]
MFYNREIYKILPEKAEEFCDFFEQYIMPVQIKNGSKLVGKWLTESRDEVMVIWEYPSIEEYRKIIERVSNDQIGRKHQEQLKKNQPYLIKTEQFLTKRDKPERSNQNITVSGYIVNDVGEMLLVRTYWRSDTWELPGGGVEDGETLDHALCREIFEETGIIVKLFGITGVYSNGETIAIIFRGKRTGGELRTSEETKEVGFFPVDPVNLSTYVKRGKFIPRVLDAMNGQYIPYEAFQVRPYKLVKRYDGEI